MFQLPCTECIFKLNAYPKTSSEVSLFPCLASTVGLELSSHNPKTYWLRFSVPNLDGLLKEEWISKCSGCRQPWNPGFSWLQVPLSLFSSMLSSSIKRKENLVAYRFCHKHTCAYTDWSPFSVNCTHQDTWTSCSFGFEYLNSWSFWLHGIVSTWVIEKLLI